MAERRHGGRRGDARGGDRGGGRGDLPNEEAARQRALRDIENDDLRQQVRDLRRDIENGDLRQQVRDLQRRLARLEKRRGKSNPMRSNASERRSVDDPLFNDVYGGQSKPVYDKDILSMPVYDEPAYDEDIFSMPVYDKSVYDEEILSMPVVYDKPVYDEDILLMSESPPPSVKFDDVAVDEDIAVDDDEEYAEAEGENRLVEFMFGNGDDADNLPGETAEFRKNDVAANQEDESGSFGSYHPSCCDMVSSLSIHITHLFQELFLPPVLFECTPNTPEHLQGANSCLVSICEPSVTKGIFISSLKKLQLLDDAGEHGKLEIIDDVSSKEKESAATDVERCLILDLSSCITEECDTDLVNIRFSLIKHYLHVSDAVSHMEAYQTLSKILEKHFSFCSTEFDVAMDLLTYVKRDDGDKVDSRTSLFQEGEYDAVIEDKSWRLRKIYFWFYLFPS